MTLPASGLITLSQVNSELSRGLNNPVSLNESVIRNLFGKPSGAIFLADGYGKARYTFGTVNSFIFDTSPSYGIMRLSIAGGTPYAAITLELTSTTSGQALGTPTGIGSLNASGRLDYTSGQISDSYWFPAPRTNYFNIRQDGNIIGNVSASSAYLLGTVQSFQFINYGSYGVLSFFINGGNPGSTIYLDLTNTTSGQPGGTVVIGTLAANGYLNYTSGQISDSYWYPASQTNWYRVRQDGNQIGYFAVSS